MKTIWFTSDFHLLHSKIIQYCGRPFKDAYEMTEALIENHNKLVKPEDDVYNLGDITMLRGNRDNRETSVKLMRRLNGHQHLLMGNHDHWEPQVYIDGGFRKLLGTGRWIDKERILLSHFPVHESSIGSATFVVHGHIHEKDSPKPALGVDKDGRLHVRPYINVCVERTGYAPMSLEQVKQQAHEIAKKVLEDGGLDRPWMMEKEQV